MMTIDCGDLITLDDQLKRRRGKPCCRYAYLNIETRLRSIARRIAEGTLKSAYADYKDDASRRYLEKRWRKLKPTLMAEAELTLKLERRDGIRIESFDLDCHKDAPIGTLAWVSTGHPFYDRAGRAGWSLAVGLSHGEVLIRRDMKFGLAAEFDAATLQAHLAQFAATGCMGAAEILNNTNLRLKIELVPRPLWGKNLRAEEILGRTGWRRLRAQLLGNGTPVATSTPQAHEEWEYIEAKGSGIARLKRIILSARTATRSTISGAHRSC